MRGSRTAILPSWQSVVRKPPNGSVLWLPGIKANQADVPDFSGSGNNGTITGATWTRLPSGLPVLVFDGDDYVSCGNDSSLNFTTQAFTIAVWIYPTATGAYRDIYCRGFYQADGYRVVWSNVNKIEFNTNQALANQDSVSSALSLSTWYRIVVTRSGASGRIYANGSDITVTAASHTNPTTSTRNAYIGQYDAGTQRFIGKIGLEGVISGTAWTAAQVAQDYQQTRHLIPV